MKTHNGFFRLQNGVLIAINFIADLIKRFLPKKGFSRGVAVIAGGTAIGQLVNVVASPILTRLYLPQDFGVFAIFSSYLGILSVAASYRYEMAIPLPTTDSDAANLLLVSTAFIGFNCLLLCVVILTCGDYFVRISNVGSFGPYLWLLPVGFGGIGLYQTLTYWAIRKKYYTILGRTKATRSFFMIGSQLLLGFFKTGPIGLLIGHVIGEAGGLGQLVGISWSKDKALINSVSVMGVRKVASRYRKFPFYMSAASLLSQAGNQLPALLLASLYSPEVAGWFFLAQKVFGLPVQLIARSVSQVFIGEAAQLVKTDLNEFRSLINRIVARFFLTACPFAIVMAIAGAWLFSFIFGEHWKMSGLFSQVMALYYLLKFSLDSLTVLQLLERQDLLLLWNSLRFILANLAIVAAASLQLSAFAAVAMFSAVMALAYIVKYLIWRTVLRNKTRI
jgi:O-antigen/teichoic acid export membrane protein